MKSKWLRLYSAQGISLFGLAFEAPPSSRTPLPHPKRCLCEKNAYREKLPFFLLRKATFQKAQVFPTPLLKKHGAPRRHQGTKEETNREPTKSSGAPTEKGRMFAKTRFHFCGEKRAANKSFFRRKKRPRDARYLS